MKEWRMFFLSYVWGTLLILQIGLTFFLFGFGMNIYLNYIGLVIWIIAVVWAWGPIFLLKMKGNVPEGKSFVNTTTLVRTGMYSIVRHPQYMAGILFSVSLILIAQNWIIMLFGTLAIPIMYIDIIKADHYCLEKFGEDYRKYMKIVPRTNFLVGIIRAIRRKR